MRAVPFFAGRFDMPDPMPSYWAAEYPESMTSQRRQVSRAGRKYGK